MVRLRAAAYTGLRLLLRRFFVQVRYRRVPVMVFGELLKFLTRTHSALRLVLPPRSAFGES